MKIFNVRVRVDIVLVTTLPDELPEPTTPRAHVPYNDDPVDKQAKMMDEYLNKAAKVFGARGPALYVPGMPGDGGDSASMTRSINVQAETFEELQAILQKFNQVAKELHAVPDSLLTAHNPSLTPLP